MLWVVWFALAFLLFVAGIGGWYVVREGLAFWATLKAFTALMGRASDVLGQRADAAVGKVGASSDLVERVTRSVDRLSRSLAYAKIVFGAAGRARAAYAGMRGRMPHK